MNESASKPENVIKIFIEAWNERDANKLASVFVEDAEFVNVTGLWWHNKNAIFKSHDYGLKVIFNNSELSLIRTKTRYLSEDIAIIHAKTALTDQTILNDDHIPHKRTNILVFIVKREDGEWKCHTTQNTEVIPGKETWIADDRGNMTAVNYGKFKDFK